mgnify:CR=1 FL=1
MERCLGILLILSLAFFAKSFVSTPQVLGESSSANEILPVNQPIVTKSSFSEKLQEETEILNKKTIYQDDSEIEAGIDKVLDEGKDGKKTKIFKITYTNTGEQYSKEIISTETILAIDKKILRGTKIVWKTLDTPDGQITYWKKMRVWATHYDQYCKGCDQWTAIGMRQGKGVIAVDPKVIKLRSKVYVPGYGLAVAGDTGGAIKGNIIDLGFDDAKTAGWSARFVDIYLL